MSNPQPQPPRAWDQRGGMEDLKRFTDDLVQYLGQRLGTANAIQTDMFAEGAVSPQSAAMIAGGLFQVDASASRYAGIAAFAVSVVDGQAVSWGPFDATPDLVVVDSHKLPVLAEGDQYDLRVTGAGPSGGTAYLKKITGGVTLTTQTGSTRTVTNADPGQVEVQKPTSGDSYDGSYRFTVTGQAWGREITIWDGGSPLVTLFGGFTISIYYRTSLGGALTLAGSVSMSPSVAGANAINQTISVSGLPAIGQHGDPEFRLIVESRVSASDYMTDVTQIAYETSSGGSVATATPSNAPALTLLVLPKTR